jgi:hypothetical protein
VTIPGRTELPIVGRTITGVTFASERELSLAFHEGGKLQASTSIRLQRRDDTTVIGPKPATAQTDALVALLDHAVHEAFVEPDGALALTVSSSPAGRPRDLAADVLLEVVPDPNYESWRFTLDETSIVCGPGGAVTGLSPDE